MRHPSYNSTYGSAGAPDVPDIPGSIATLTDAVYRPSTAPIDRAASAPIAEYKTQSLASNGMPAHPAFQNHLPKSRSNSRHEQSKDDIRRISPNFYPPISEHDRGRGMSTTTKEIPPLLAELQHLASPPPPPPPPPAPAPTGDVFSATPGGVIRISVNDGQFQDDTGVQVIEIPEDGRSNTPAIESVSLEPAPPGTAVRHRRARSNASNGTNGTGDHLGNKFKAMADRMRSTSRGRGPRSPPIETATTISPYESIPALPKTSPRGLGMGMTNGMGNMI